MKKIFYLCFSLVSCIVIFSSCGTTGTGVLYSERSITPSDVRYQRVAILPNRLPLNLTDPERWRMYNWEVMQKRFIKEGFQVIEYTTSVEMFSRSGLPLEDTKVSRDKYAELAEEMNADILIFPFYGTSFRISGITDKNNYEVTGSLQIYLADQNDFMTRIDFEGNNYYRAFSKILPLAMAGGFFLLTNLVDDPDIMMVGTLAMPVGYLATLIPLFTPARVRWERAFRYSINKGLDQFFAKYQGRGSTTAKPMTAKPVTSVPEKAVLPVEAVSQKPVSQESVIPESQTVKAPVVQDKPLSYYSVDELEQMKQQAVDAKDFRKAAAIKEEIDKRTK